MRTPRFFTSAVGDEEERFQLDGGVWIEQAAETEICGVEIAHAREHLRRSGQTVRHGGQVSLEQHRQDAPLRGEEAARALRVDEIELFEAGVENQVPCQ